MKKYGAYAICNLFDVNIGKLEDEHVVSLGMDVNDYNIVTSQEIDEIMAHMLLLKREVDGASLNTFKPLYYDGIRTWFFRFTDRKKPDLYQGVKL